MNIIIIINWVEDWTKFDGAQGSLLALLREPSGLGYQARGCCTQGKCLNPILLPVLNIIF